jgi:hypothetical protein
LERLLQRDHLKQIFVRAVSGHRTGAVIALPIE